MVMEAVQTANTIVNEKRGMTTAASKMGNSSELGSVDFARYVFVFLSLFVFVIAFVFDENDKEAKTTVVERARQLQRCSVGRAQVAPLTSKHQ